MRTEILSTNVPNNRHEGCMYEVQPLTEGYRLGLVYTMHLPEDVHPDIENRFHYADALMKAAAETEKPLRSHLRSIAGQIHADKRGNHPLIYALDAHYTLGTALGQLETADRARFVAVRRMKVRRLHGFKIRVFLASVEARVKRSYTDGPTTKVGKAKYRFLWVTNLGGLPHGDIKDMVAVDESGLLQPGAFEAVEGAANTTVDDRANAVMTTRTVSYLENWPTSCAREASTLQS